MVARNEKCLNPTSDDNVLIMENTKHAWNTFEFYSLIVKIQYRPQFFKKNNSVRKNFIATP